MEILIAILHILGSVISLFLFWFALFFVSGWEIERSKKQAVKEISIALGVAVEDLDREELAPKILKLLGEKYSTELFTNRLSDFCGLIRDIWGWLGLMIQFIILVTVIWNTIENSLQNAVFAWSILGVALFFWFLGVIFSFTCKLLTGRYPGEAKNGRKLAAEWVENNSELLKRHNG